MQRPAQNEAPLVIGIGNEFRRDDAAGLRVVRHLRDRALTGVEILEMEGEGTALMQAWAGAKKVILVDAIVSNAGPGYVHRFHANSGGFPPQLKSGGSSHQFGLADAVNLALSLNQIPENLVVYGIEGKDFKQGVGLTPEVETAVQSVVEYLIKDLR